MKCRLVLRLIVPAAIVAGAACRPGEDRARGPTLRLLESTPLRESESAYVARPSLSAVGPDGSLYVTDLFLGRVARFSRDGELMQLYGRQGDGPGELRSISLPVLIDDTTLAVADQAHLRFNLYDRRTGMFRRTRSVRGILRSAQLREGVLWAGDMVDELGTTVLRWDLSRDSLRYLGNLPAPYKESPVLRGIHPSSQIQVWADTVLLGLGGSDVIRVLDTTGSVLDSFTIPVVRRRGASAERVRRMTSPDLPFPDMFSMISHLMAIHRTRDGTLILVHADGRIEGRRITDSLFVSLVSPDRRSACVDTYLHTTDVSQPVVAFDDDTLLVLNQQIAGDEIRTIVDRFAVESEDCLWIPTAPDANGRTGS